MSLDHTNFLELYFDCTLFLVHCYINEKLYIYNAYLYNKNLLTIII